MRKLLPGSRSIGCINSLDWRKENTMKKNLTPELQSLKEEFDFLNKKIGELKWKEATIFYGKIGISQNELDLLEDRINIYTDSMNLLLETIRNQVKQANNTKE
ncbi:MULTISPECIES: hypothetical protein [unclassified Breznakia]|uniref:hypothetical protein n=1 Tax=unclassified Breznakia TaxID=2623764 RepID=UPI0024751965|nr:MULTISPECIES: hypothetical protein [unclassified Breznakia]MDH6366419.1 hypothetical protein [Breznakia sp. PH1-1]MDH6403512.1 hypothetical protein [Breznakia sp. PF1-11]MDH6411221.1 hypothetical protein [Breznakia sp. PFB1-11]MDH6413516.1 hypothetical protein [Breznakia sp. PFB1-14]MDH6415766.1 hypothetical protein [Breznakia sp. PFB1-4]